MLVFALTLTLSPRRGDTWSSPLHPDGGTIYSLSLEGEGRGEGVALLSALAFIMIPRPREISGWKCYHVFGKYAGG